MKLFVDNCLSFRLAKAVNMVVGPEGHQVIALREKFPQGIPDTEWIAALGREGGWSVLSDDRKLKRIPAERAAWANANLTGFFIAPGWRKMRIVEQTGRLLLHWPNMVKFEEAVQAGAMVVLPVRTGKLKAL